MFINPYNIYIYNIDVPTLYIVVNGALCLVFALRTFKEAVSICEAPRRLGLEKLCGSHVFVPGIYMFIECERAFVCYTMYVCVCIRIL